MSAFIMKGDDLKAAAQSVLEAKRMARSLESLSESLIPLTTEDDSGKAVNIKLRSIMGFGRDASNLLSEIYAYVAREAMMPPLSAAK